MASPTVNVFRYSALAFGIAYGWYHHKTLKSEHEKHKIEHAIHNRERLVREAKEAFRKKKETSKSTSLITDPEDPHFDLEKVLVTYGEAAS